MPIGPTSGFLDFTNATPRADVIIALSNVGVGTDVPLHALDIRGTANVADIIINNDLTLIGGLTTNSLTINSMSMSTTSNFQQVTNVGNVTTNTVEFTNPTTGLAVTSNAEVGGELSVSGNVEVGTANLFVDTTTGNVGVGTTDPTHGRMQIVCSSQSPDGGLTVRGGDYNAGLGAMWVEGDGSGQRFKIQAYRNESTDPPAGVNPSTLDADVFELCLNPKGGNVGIGTTNPTSSLHVYGNILGHPVIKTRTITKGSSLSEETETFTLNADENRIVLNNNQGSVGSTRRYYANFTSGVPTTVGTILHLEINSQRINTDATGRGHQSVIQFNGTAVLDTGYIILSATGGNDSYERQLQRTIILTDDGWKDYSMYPKISSPTTDDALIFSTTRHATATDLGQTELTERMRIDGDGNVGIGAASPSHKLTVRAASGDAEVHIQAQGNGSTGAIIYFNGSATNQRKCAILSSPINSWCRQDLHFCHNTSQNYDDVTIADSKMVITNAGNVGIGTTNPAAKLDVNGYMLNNNPVFHAYLSGTGNTTTLGVFNSFTSTYINRGGHYYTSGTNQGKFIAPVAGVYYFSANMLHRQRDANGPAEITFYKNGTNVGSRGLAYTSVSASADHDNLHIELTIELAVNDYIQVAIYSLASNTDFYVGESLANFRGFLIG